MNRLFSASTSAVTACGQTRGENAATPPRAAHRLRTASCARNSIVAAPAPQTAENRFTRHAIVPIDQREEAGGRKRIARGCDTEGVATGIIAAVPSGNSWPTCADVVAGRRRQAPRR